MKTVRLNGVTIEPNTVAAIGFFDGVHLAHKELIQKTIDIANEKGLPKAIITFDVHPKSILFGLDYRYITPLKRKLEIFQEFDIDTVYLIEFTKEKARLKPDEFINQYLSGIDTLVCGFDFTFGVRGSGNVTTLLHHHEFETIVVDEITYDGYKVGSTHIRDLINSGLVDQVREVMGDDYTITGEVIHGEKKGRTIGYPTANVDAGEYLVPKTGVYATVTKIGNAWYDSMSSVGHNPTLNPQVHVSVESHILDFDEDLYGQDITIKFLARLREELRFNSAEELITQIQADETQTRRLLKNRK